MAVYTVNSQDLTSVANAIRAKGGTTAKLSYPDGFATAITNLNVDNRPKFSISGGNISHTLTIDRYSGDGVNDWLLTLWTGATHSSDGTDAEADSFTLTFTKLDTPVDIFCCGGGGSGGISSDTGNNYTGGGGGGGGRTATGSNKTLTVGTAYSCKIGVGGAVVSGTCTAGGATSCGGVTANGGNKGTTTGAGANGGSGGGGGGYSSGTAGGAGGSNGGAGTAVGSRSGGTGQGTTTYAFGSTAYPMFGAGGGGGCGVSSGSPGTNGSPGAGVNGPKLNEPSQQARISEQGWSPNRNNNNMRAHYGGGGWGSGPSKSKTAGTGGNGIIMIRNHRG